MNPAGLLEKAVLVRRYKRFLADVQLASGEVVVVHCPNPGSMLGCAEPGSAVFLRKSNAPNRKLPYTWVVTEVGATLISVDTLLANKIVGAALRQGSVAALSHYKNVVSEYTFGSSRFDFLLDGCNEDTLATTAQPQFPSCIVEVKSTTLCDGATAMFPDAKTERGRKHLHGLMEARKQGIRAVQFYCISRSDATRFAPAKHIDPAYAAALVEAVRNGVEVMAWNIEIAIEQNLLQVRLCSELPVDLA